MHHLYFEASAGIYFAEDAEMTEITTAIPRRMSVRLQDGIILKNGDSFQMCITIGTPIPLRTTARDLQVQRYSLLYMLKEKDNTLRVDTNTYLMAYRFHYA